LLPCRFFFVFTAPDFQKQGRVLEERGRKPKALGEAPGKKGAAVDVTKAAK
jgi:hypothetical protein